MKVTLSFFALGALLLVAPHANPHLANARQAAAAQVERTPIVVELFTSEGCSSCPPADALLSKLETDQPVQDAEIIGLEEHVDYWNHDGWVDPYSSPEWTSRQEEYVEKFKDEGPYTPQMIVDGQSQFVGNNERSVAQAIQEAARQAKTKISIAVETPAMSDGERLEVRVGNVSGTSDREPADVWLAVTETYLKTAVKSGENAGRNLEHAAVVRYLHKIGAAQANGSSAFALNPQVKFKSSWKRANLKVAVFIQERKSLRILGAASVRVAG